MGRGSPVLSSSHWVGCSQSRSRLECMHFVPWLSSFKPAQHEETVNPVWHCSSYPMFQRRQHLQLFLNRGNPSSRRLQWKRLVILIGNSTSRKHGLNFYHLVRPPVHFWIGSVLFVPWFSMRLGQGNPLPTARGAHDVSPSNQPLWRLSKQPPRQMNHGDTLSSGLLSLSTGLVQAMGVLKAGCSPTSLGRLQKHAATGAFNCLLKSMVCRFRAQENKCLY